MITMMIIMLFKEVILNTGIINILPDYFENSLISPIIIYAVIFFIGTIIIGSQGVIAIMLPLIYSTIPNIGIGYFILLMSITYIASQVSPSHICLGIITEHTGISFDKLIGKTIPVLIIFIIIAVIYSYFLSILIG